MFNVGEYGQFNDQMNNSGQSFQMDALWTSQAFDQKMKWNQIWCVYSLSLSIYIYNDHQLSNDR
jgi:hypothetical protein